MASARYQRERDMKGLLSIVTLLVASSAYGQLNPDQECTLHGAVAWAITQVHAQGMTKAEAIEGIQTVLFSEEALPDWMRRLIDDTVNEVYDYDPVDARAYRAYKIEACHQRLLGRDPGKSFAEVHHELSMCGNLESFEEITECAKRAARGLG